VVSAKSKQIPFDRPGPLLYQQLDAAVAVEEDIGWYAKHVMAQGHDLGSTVTPADLQELSQPRPVHVEAEGGSS
jgi:hypothetical protein